jgi:hypothetical protein
MRSAETETGSRPGDGSVPGVADDNLFNPKTAACFAMQFAGNIIPMFKADKPGSPFDHLMRAVQFHHPSRAYGAQVRELYLLGTFLAKKKYRFLRLGYISFITGLFASFAGFIIEVLFQSSSL